MGAHLLHPHHTEPNAAMAPVHDRMPVILPREDEAAWIDTEHADVDALRALLVPYAGDLVLTQVSSLVNNVRNDSPACIEAVA